MPGRWAGYRSAPSSKKRSRGGVEDEEENKEEDEDEDEDGDEVVHLQRVRSGFQDAQGRRKRVRLSKADESGPGPSKRSDEDDLDDTPGSPLKSQYELRRDGDGNHLRHVEKDDLRATQRLLAREQSKEKRREFQSQPAESGIIEKVVCKNFMCHRNLVVELGPLLNFIVGENGSGKSAVLTAITLCLGGKASSTNRGGSLKSFIHSEAEKAELIVTIKNQGEGAFGADTYGESIVVERHFSKKGPSGYRIKSDTGYVVSTKRDEVDKMVEWFCLQMDNPLNVLSQDNARQFLNSATKTQKYRFWREGVLLDTLDSDYKTCDETLQLCEAKIPEQEERVKVASEDFERARRMKEARDGNRQLRAKKKELLNLCVWAIVLEQETELTARREDLLKVEGEISSCRQKSADLGRTLETYDQVGEAREKEIEEARLEENEQQAKIEEMELAFNQIKSDRQRLLHDEREAHSESQNCKEINNDLRQKIEEEKGRIAQNEDGSAQAAKLEELERAKEAAVEAGKRLDSAKAGKPEVQERLKQVEASLAKAEEDARRKQDEVQGAKVRLGQLQGNQGSAYAAYEANMLSLTKMINSSPTEFDQKPIGPLGQHIQLLKPQWSSVLESTLGKTLNGFLVCSHKDQMMLQALLDRCRLQHSPIFRMRQQVINSQGKEPDAAFDTILRVLKMEDVRVRNLMIINHAIDQIILVEDRVKAQDIMFSDSPPDKVRACFALNAQRRGEGHSLKASNAGLSTEPIRAFGGKARMKTDSEYQIAFAEESLQQLEREAASIRSDKANVERNRDRLRRELDQLERDVLKVESEVRKAHVLVGSKEDELEEIIGDDSRLRGLETQYQEAQEKLHHHGNQYGALAAQRAELDMKIDSEHRRLKNAKEEVRKIKARIQKAVERQREVGECRDHDLKIRNDLEARLEELKRKEEESQQRIERQESRVADFTEKAQRFHQEPLTIPEGETAKSLRAQYDGIAKRLEEEARKTGRTDEQVNDDYVRTDAAYHKVKSDLRAMRSSNQALNSTLVERFEKYRRFMRYISSACRSGFCYLLDERGFRGRLLLDHDNKALDIQVEPDESVKMMNKTEGRSTKTLSGGEKSFSSICLLVAIWEAMGSPIRCLDEFDVFMDNVNRAKSTEMLIKTARGTSRQYIFITPNAIQGHKNFGTCVKIHRLVDPRQTTISQNSFVT